MEDLRAGCGDPGLGPDHSGTRSQSPPGSFKAKSQRSVKRRNERNGRKIRESNVIYYTELGYGVCVRQRLFDSYVGEAACMDTPIPLKTCWWGMGR